MTQASELLTQLEQLSGDPTEAAAQAIQIHHFARDAKKAHSVDWDAVQKKAKAVITDIMIEFGVDRITTQAGRAWWLRPRPGYRVNRQTRRHWIMPQIDHTPPLFQQLASRAQMVYDFACLINDLGAPGWRVDAEIALSSELWDRAKAEYLAYLATLPPQQLAFNFERRNYANESI